MKAVNPKVVTMKQAKKKAWDSFSIYIRARDAKRDSFLLDGEAAFCITCGKPYPVRGKGCLQAGHYIGGRHNQVLFDEKLVFAQCYNCNVNLRGNPIPYRRKMVELYGEEALVAMEDARFESKGYTVPDLLEMAEDFARKARNL